GLTDDRRNGRHSGFACRPPAPLAGDQLPAAARTRANDDRLDDPLGADRLRETGGRVVVEATAWLARVRVDRVDRQLRQVDLGGAAEQHLEASAEAAAGRFRR